MRLGKPYNFDEFCNDPGRKFCHYVRLEKASKEGAFAVKTAEVRMLALLFLEHQGYECGDAINAATQELMHVYGLLPGGNRAHPNFAEMIPGLAHGFVERARHEIGKIAVKKSKNIESTNVDEMFEECDNFLRGKKFKSDNGEKKLEERQRRILGSAIKHLIALCALQYDGYTCSGALNTAERKLYDSCIEAKLARTLRSAKLCGGPLLEELNLRINANILMGGRPFGGRN